MPHLTAATRRAAIVALREAADFSASSPMPPHSTSRATTTLRTPRSSPPASCWASPASASRLTRASCHEDAILEGHKWDRPSERDVLQGARASATDAQFCEVA
jgi:hypothetical protein